MADNNESQVFDAEINFTTSGVEDALADAGALDDLMQSLAEGVTATVDVAIEGDDFTTLEDLDSTTYNPSVEPTVDSEEVDSLEALDGETIETTVDAHNSPEGKSLLTTLHELGVNPVQVVMNIAGTAVDLLGTLERFTVEPFLDLEDTVAKFNAQTGNALPNARELFQSILGDDLGDSVEQIGQVATKAAQIHAPIEEATRAALTFTHTFSDANPSEVLDTLNQLVINGLAPNFEAAADIITVGFQNGANRSGDLLKAVADNATAFKDLGFTGQEAMSFITSGLDAGFNSASEIATTLTKLKQNIAGAANNPTSDVSKTLDFLGIANPTETGEGWSADFVQSVIDAIKNAPVDDATKQDMVASLLGGKLGAKEYSAFLNLDANKAVFDQVTGAAETAATETDNSLRGIFDDFVTAINAKVAELLSSDAIDLPGKIELLKTGLQDALATLQSGGSLQDALTVGLKPLGFDDEFQKLESIFGNLVISFLQIVADIQSILGKDNTGTKAEITRLGAQQLPYDLKIANPDDITNTIKTAVDRGVDAQTIADSAATAVTELVKNGATEQAQALVDSLKTGGQIAFDVTDPIAKKVLEGQGLDTSFTIPINADMSAADIQAKVDETVKTFGDEGITIGATITPTVPQAELDTLQKQIDDAVQEANKTALGGLGDKLATGTGFLQTGQVGFGAAGGNAALGLTGGDLAGKSDEVAKSVRDVSTAIGEQQTALEDVQPANTDFITSLGDMVASAQESSEAVESGAMTMSDAMQAADDDITNAISGNSMIPELEKLSRAAEESSSIVVTALKAINNSPLSKVEAAIDDMIYRLQLLVAEIGAVQTAATAAASAGANAGSTGRNTTTNNNNVTINTTSNAQAAAAGQVTVNGLTGRAV